MINRKKMVAVPIRIAAMFSLLLLSNCQARRPGPTSSPTASLTTPPSSSPTAPAIPVVTLTDEPPIILVSSDDQNGKTIVHLTCLNGREHNREIDVESKYPIHVSGSMMDDDGNIYVPTWRFGSSDILYIVPRDNSIREFDLKMKEASSCQYCYGRMVFCSSARDANIVIMEMDFSYKVVRPKTAIRGLVKGEENRVIAFSDLPIEKNGKQFAPVFIIDLSSGEITGKLLPAPLSKEPSNETPLSPTVKYNLIFIGVSEDLKKLYYSYFEAEESGGHVLYPRLGMFDTESEKELHTCSECCSPPDGYHQYKEYLFASHSPEAGGSALLLNMKDLSPVVDLYELLKAEETSKVLISPFGKYFIVGTQNKVFLLSQKGLILKEYPLPPELIDKDYTIVEYFEDG